VSAKSTDEALLDATVADRRRLREAPAWLSPCARRAAAKPRSEFRSNLAELGEKPPPIFGPATVQRGDVERSRITVGGIALARGLAATSGAAGLPGHIKVLLADSDSDRVTILEQRLREISDAVILRVPGGSSLLDAVAALTPDVILVDMARPDRDGLDDLRRVSADNPRPIVMFVDRDDRAFMEEAIAAGVSSYNVVDTAFPDIKPIVMAAVAIFRKHQQVADDLTKARATLDERATINRAKSMLMRQRNIDEPQAYRWLRRRAMNESRRIGEIAAELLASASERETPK
jgi:response regulator NasT